MLELMRYSKSRFIEDARRVGTGAVREPPLPFSRLVGTVSNCANAVRLETAPTGGRKCLFIFRIHYKREKMQTTNGWRVGITLFLVISLAISSGVVTVVILRENIKKGQSIAKGLFVADPLARQGEALPQDLVTAHIQQDDFPEHDFIVSALVTQYVSPGQSTQKIQTDTLLKISHAKRPRTSIDEEIVQALQAELTANPPQQRRRAIQDQLERISAETITSAETHRISRYQ